MVTLGGCHLLDGLKAVDTVEHRLDIITKMNSSGLLGL